MTTPDADRSGWVEATVIGNVVVRGGPPGLLSGSVEDLRALVARTFPLAEYRPRGREEKKSRS